MDSAERSGTPFLHPVPIRWMEAPTQVQQAENWGLDHVHLSLFIGQNICTRSGKSERPKAINTIQHLERWLKDFIQHSP